MLESVSSVVPSWATRNLHVLTVFAPVLLLTGVLGFLLPAEMSLMSGAAPYNVFHLVAGLLGLRIALRRSVAGSVSFNLVFGCIDLWQAVAGVTGLPPAHLFALRPTDHVLHVVIGLALVGLACLGKKAS